MPMVDSESRICFALEWYDSEEEAEKRGKQVEEKGDTYNGGWNHGRLCGRDRGFDRILDDGKKLYAVTTA